MQIPMADVPRWYAERKPDDAIAISHGDATLTWWQLERNANRRARAFMAKGVKPGDFVAIGLSNGNEFYETSFAIWKCGATPTSLSWRLPRDDTGKVRRTLLRDERATWLKENRAFQIFPHPAARQGRMNVVNSVCSTVLRNWRVRRQKC